MSFRLLFVIIVYCVVAIVYMYSTIVWLSLLYHCSE